MCDYVAGELLAGHHAYDSAAKNLIGSLGNEPELGISVVETMKAKLAALEPSHGETWPEYEMYRLKVRKGDELNAIGTLYSLYAAQANDLTLQPWFLNPRNRFHVSTHARMSLSAVSTADFSFSRLHTTSYKSMLTFGRTVSSTGTSPVRIAVIDSGLDSAKPAPVKLGIASDVIHPGATVVDKIGHGTVVASIVSDLAPTAVIDVYRVADAKFGDIVEWDVLAALIDSSGADVINLSLGFGLGTVACGKCGRQSGSSRSKLFEHVVSGIAARVKRPVVVAAAGNAGLPELDFPARFGDVVAVGSVDSTPAPSLFSNVGTTDANGRPHPSVFVAPGGQDPAVNATECVGSTTGVGGQTWWGTSFSAAYVSGLLALHISTGQTPTAALNIMKARANSNFSKFSASDHGYGIPRI